jgi:hypothetical protein
MSIERIQTQSRMSQAVIHNGTVYLSGQVAFGAVGGSVAEQTKDILSKIDSLLAAAKADKSKILSATIWPMPSGVTAKPAISNNVASCQALFERSPACTLGRAPFRSRWKNLMVRSLMRSFARKYT